MANFLNVDFFANVREEGSKAFESREVAVYNCKGSDWLLQGHFLLFAQFACCLNDRHKVSHLLRDCLVEKAWIDLSDTEMVDRKFRESATLAESQSHILENVLSNEWNLRG